VPDTDALFLGARMLPGDESLLPAWAETSVSFTQWSAARSQPA